MCAEIFWIKLFRHAQNVLHLLPQVLHFLLQLMHLLLDGVDPMAGWLITSTETEVKKGAPFCGVIGNDLLIL